MNSKNHKRFIELRATGLSYNKIADQMSVSKPTLIKWSRELANDIKNAKALELETLREEYLLSREHRLKVMGTQLSKLTKEILNRDLSEVPTWRMFDIQRKLITEIAKEDETVEFTQEIEKTVSDTLNGLNKKTVNWNG